MNRTDKILGGINPRDLEGIEIGPLAAPIVKKEDGSIIYVDHASRAELVEKYSLHDPVAAADIVEVDAIWGANTFREALGPTKTVDYVVASHVIEHVPDFVTYLQQLSSLLTPDGILSLVIPDKRYCFDYFMPISTTGNMLDAYVAKRVKPSNGQIFDHYANASSLNGSIAWGPSCAIGTRTLVHSFAEANAQWDRSTTSDDYIDVHIWRFTPSEFRLIISDLANLGLIDLEIKTEFETVGCEFFVSLGKKGQVSSPSNRLESLQVRKMENV